jgi:hypothetical protein
MADELQQRSTDAIQGVKELETSKDSGQSSATFNAQDVADLRRQSDAARQSVRQLILDDANSHANINTDSSHDNQLWSPWLVAYLVFIMLAFAVFALYQMRKLLEQNRASIDILRIFTMPLVIVFSVIMVVIGYSRDQMTPVIGLLGTMIGYVLGAAHSPSLPSALQSIESHPAPVWNSQTRVLSVPKFRSAANCFKFYGQKVGTSTEILLGETRKNELKIPINALEEGSTYKVWVVVIGAAGWNEKSDSVDVVA